MATATNTQQHVFVSYSRRNTDAMQRVSQALRQANIPVWTDERLTAGTPSWKNTIEHALKGAFCVVVLMSPSAKTSEWVERELDYAYVLQRPIFPILVEGSQLDSVPFELINMQYIDARTDFDESVKHLIGLLSSYIVVPVAELAATQDIDMQESKLQPLRVIAPTELSSNIREPSVIDILLHSFGMKRDDSEIIEKYARGNRRILFWYFLEPRKFHLFSAITQDSIARVIHTSMIAIAYLWLFGSVLISVLPSITAGAVAVCVVVCYGVIFFVPMASAYKTRISFFSSIAYALLLVALFGILIWITYILYNSLSVVLKVS